MKNVITLDTEEGLVPELNVISTAENAIYFRIYNPGTSAKLEVYYGCDYKKDFAGYDERYPDTNRVCIGRRDDTCQVCGCCD